MDPDYSSAGPGIGILPQGNAPRHFGRIGRDKGSLHPQKSRTGKGSLIKIEQLFLSACHIFGEGILSHGNTTALIDIIIDMGIAPDGYISTAICHAITIHRFCILSYGYTRISCRAAARTDGHSRPFPGRVCRWSCCDGPSPERADKHSTDDP